MDYYLYAETLLVSQEVTVITTDFFQELKRADIKDIIVFGSVCKIEDFAFSNMALVKRITFNEGLEEIGKMAFANCSTISTLTFPSSVKKVGKMCFWNCSNLKSIRFLDGDSRDANQPLTIYKSTFKNCRALKELVIPENVDILWEDL